MDSPFFFITTYDNISGPLVASLLNIHPALHCSTSLNDLFIGNSHPNFAKNSHENIDHYIDSHSRNKKKFNGNAERYTAYELQNKILMERTRHPLRKVNLVLSPQLRINFILHSWLDYYKTADVALSEIEQQIDSLSSSKHDFIVLYRFDDVYQHIKNTAINENIDVNEPNNKLYLLALAKVITQDSADLLSTGRQFCFEPLISNQDYFIEFINYLTKDKVDLDFDYKALLLDQQKNTADYIAKFQNQAWETWQTNLLDKYLSLRLQTLHFQHIAKPLAAFYTGLGYDIASYQIQRTHCYSKLISIQLNSNRPAQLAIYFDNIEETADDPSKIEVLVNIDDNDSAMEEMLIREIPQRTFTIKFIKTPRPASFCDLWQPINKLLSITDPNAYFLVNISDEMLFETKGWDTVLKKYVGYFPDHIFRLRASRNKFRNYFDRWECSFAQDSIPITTKKWIDIGGDWNPCFGPDSYQQLIAFYLAKEGMFSGANYLRELPIIDIKFQGDVPSLGISQEKAWKHNRDHIFAMQICQSYPMQLEARRRAMMLKANIIAAANQISDFDIHDDKTNKLICLVNRNTNEHIGVYSYKLNWLSIFITNQIRKLRFYAYFGGGKEYKRNHILGFAGYLKAKYGLIDNFYLFLRKFQKGNA